MYMLIGEKDKEFVVTYAFNNRVYQQTIDAETAEFAEIRFKAMYLGRFISVAESNREAMTVLNPFLGRLERRSYRRGQPEQPQPRIIWLKCGAGSELNRNEMKGVL